MRTFATVLIGSFLIMTFVGCEASKGAGKDLENTGENIQETVDKATK